MSTSTETQSLTPLMRQYYDIKKRYPDTLLLFQVGDFYELFFDDAHKASAFLGIALTKRGFQGNEPIPLCGVPVHAIDHYVLKLVRGGFRVALCDQLTPAQTGKMIERGVTYVLTPGTLTDLKLLNEKTASYLAAVFPTEDSYGLVFAEILTGQLYATIVSRAEEKLFEAELSRFLPDEIIIPDTKLGKQLDVFLKRLGYVITVQPFAVTSRDHNEHLGEWLKRQFPESSLSFVNQSSTAQAALSLVYSFLRINQERALHNFKQLFTYSPDDFLLLDAATQKNLELVKNAHDGSSAHTLFSILDAATTAMGSRLIKKWLLRPLLKKEAIEQRLSAVESLVTQPLLVDSINVSLRDIGDLERIVGRIALRRAHLYDYTALLRALSTLPQLKQDLIVVQHVELLGLVASRLGDFSFLHDLLSRSLNLDTAKDWKIQAGFSPELDRLRMLIEQAAQAILELERKEQQATGIASLKIRYSKAHGYGIEVTKANLSAVPERYTRLQTLTNRERFTTQELKDLEYDLNRAHTDINEVEKQIFEAVCQHVEAAISPLKKLAQALAHLDALMSLAKVAYTHNYTRPHFNDEHNIIIKEGYHPVVHAEIKHHFIPNDTRLTDNETLWIITGPNMGGKSTYLRQVALIALMAQAGSFVPARSADLFILDRIFTRIGAGDNVAQGKSTFLVEMEETALICTQATRNSLVILDEVGRGTSTYDGLAIAQAVVEYIYSHIKARCLFATHYHELTQLTLSHRGIVAYHTASKQTPEGIVLLHKIMKGNAQGSFGIEVARQANLPAPIIQRSQEILKSLTASRAAS